MTRKNRIEVICDRCGVDERAKPNDESRQWQRLGKYDLCWNCQDRETIVRLEVSTDDMGMGEIADMLISVANDLRKWTMLPRQELYLSDKENQRASCKAWVNKDGVA